MPDQNQPLPCPFCGQESPRLYQSGGYWKIKCTDGCLIAISGYLLKANAVVAWNRRPVQQVPIGAVAELIRAAEQLLKYRDDDAVLEALQNLDAILDDMKSAIEKIRAGEASKPSDVEN